MHFSFLTMEADDEVKPIPAGPWFEMWIDPWPQPNRIYCCLCGGKNRSDDGWCFSKDTTFQRRSSSDEMMTMLRLMGAYGDSSRNLTRPLSKTQLYSYVCAYCREKDVNRSRMEFAQDGKFSIQRFPLVCRKYLCCTGGACPSNDNRTLCRPVPCTLDGEDPFENPVSARSESNCDRASLCSSVWRRSIQSPPLEAAAD